MIKQKIEQGIASGIQQIVFLGGGYDIRGLVTAIAYPNGQIYEIDRGLTRQCKLEGLGTIPQGIGFDHLRLETSSSIMTLVNNNMHYISADLSVEELAAVLNGAGFEQDKATLFIAEGLAMYLDEAANERLLASVHDLMQLESEFIISHIDKPMYSRLSKDVQTTSKELLKFVLPLEIVIDYMSRFELAVTQKFSPLDSLDLLQSNNANYYSAHSEEAREYYYTLKKEKIGPHQRIGEVPITPVTIPEKPLAKPSFCRIL
jgi:O-methyltransferase involved in polyketide biosynthesis